MSTSLNFFVWINFSFLVGVCRPLLQILTLFQTKKLSYPTPFFRPGVSRNYVAITWIRTPTKRVLKTHLEFAYYDKYVHTFPRKPYPNSDQDRQSLYPFSDPENGAKTLPFGTGHTHKINIREYPPEHTPRMA